jgi:hypothetical protein
MERKPWAVISFFEYPSRRSAAFSVLSVSGREDKHRREDVAPPARVRLDLAKNRDSLRGKRDNMLLAHLHAVARDAPIGFLAVERELRPLGGAKLAGAHKHVWRELECTVNRRLSDVTVDGSKELTNASGIDKSCMIGHGQRRQRSAKIGCRIAHCTPRCD